MHSTLTIAFLLGVAVGALLLGAFLLILNELEVYGESRNGGVIDLSSSEARAAFSDRRRP